MSLSTKDTINYQVINGANQIVICGFSFQEVRLLKWLLQSNNPAPVRAYLRVFSEEEKQIDNEMTILSSRRSSECIVRV